MSDTDDTEDLLLMPAEAPERPIFLEDNFVPYFDIVDKLITQVSKLKNRITSIENSSDISLGSIDTLINMQSSDSSNTCRRCYSYESLPQHTEYRRQCFSTQSTPQKPRSKLMLKNAQPKFEEELATLRKVNMLRAKIEKGDCLGVEEVKSRPLIEESHIMREIDDFLANVKPSSRSEVVRSLDFEKCSEKQSKTLLDVQQILKEMDEQEEKIKNMFDERTETNSVENSDKNLGAKCSSIDWKKGLEMMSITSTDSSINDKLHEPKVNSSANIDEKNCSQVMRNSKSQPNQLNLQSSISNIESSENSGRLSGPKKSVSNPQFDIHSNAKDALSMHKKLLDDTKYNNLYDNSNLGSLSLVNLWGNGRNPSNESTDKAIQKLQEEKMRRTHCEELIQELQNKILEQQEKLAVAIQVDEAKDKAIIKFHDAWEKATQKFKLVLKERDELQMENSNLTLQNQKMSEQYEERVEYHRKETNQALSIIQEHQAKLENVSKNVNELFTENDNLKSLNQQLENKLKIEEDKNKQLSSILANKEIELNESKNILQHAKKEVAQCQAAVDICQKDFSTIKAEYDLIQDEIKAERLNVSQLHEQNKVLHDEIETQKKSEKTLRENLKEAQDKLENNKKELRNFYQGQVELLVQTKLKEFQKQLDEAERKMKEELSKKEMEIARSAAMHIKQIQDKYSLEINLIEQKHQEEMQLKQVKTAQIEQRLSDLQHKFDTQHDKKAQLVKQLHKVMEAQWMEALRIINVPHDESSSTMDQLHSLQSKSYQNMEALLSDEYVEKPNNSNFNGKETVHYNGRYERKTHHRTHETNGGLRSKSSKHDDNNLQKYINLLLNKQPGNPLESKEKPNQHKLFNDHPSKDKQWQYSESSHYSKMDFEENSPHFDESKKKTPWK